MKMTLKVKKIKGTDRKIYSLPTWFEKNENLVYMIMFLFFSVVMLVFMLIGWI